jgi:RNA polymerase sigma-70 factor (ECF subfamily)
MMSLKDSHSINETFEAFWTNWYSRIFTYTSTFGSFTYEDREDVTQEIILKLWSNKNTYNKKYAVSTWVFASARNHCIDVLRKLNRQQLNQHQLVQQQNQWQLNRQQLHQHLQPQPWNNSVQDDPWETLGDPSAEEKVLKKNRIYLLDKALSQLSQEDQELFFLRYSEEMEYESISKLLAIPVGTLKSRISRGKKELKAILNHWDYPDKEIQ